MKPKKLTYLKDVCVVRILEEQAIGHIVLPEVANRYHVQKALVLDVGRKFRHKNEVRIGDTVLVSTYFGNKAKHTDVDGDVRTYDGEDILAKIS